MDACRSGRIELGLHRSYVLRLYKLVATSAGVQCRFTGANACRV
jgi:hypothetical protein